METAAAYLLVVAATVFVLAACVVLQYEYLVVLWGRLALHQGPRRITVLYGIFGVLFLHVLEICVFAATLWALALWPPVGELAGQEATEFLDYLYFSGVTFTTVGFGELWPVGPIRLLCALEALAGLVLITWSASFTYLEMEKSWRGS